MPSEARPDEELKKVADDVRTCISNLRLAPGVVAITSERITGWANEIDEQVKRWREQHPTQTPQEASGPPLSDVGGGNVPGGGWKRLGANNE